eukprot:TRINITY_DN1090_c0_g1_i1.p1 TRINITY_DN1090_c0_g1~~TRINITY_DN1090_c0_g1_i1.p1  ORF type:complete len:188 (+),score=18.50 TRINITY_DN1090_c0_g1_i1:71-634(+)
MVPYATVLFAAWTMASSAQKCEAGDIFCAEVPSDAGYLLQHSMAKQNVTDKKDVKKTATAETCPSGSGQNGGTTAFCTNPSLSSATNCPMGQTCDAAMGATGCCCFLGNPFHKCSAVTPAPAPPSPSTPIATGSCPSGSGKSGGTAPFCTNPSFSSDTNCPMGQTCDAGMGETGCCCLFGNPFHKCS